LALGVKEVSAYLVKSVVDRLIGSLFLGVNRFEDNFITPDVESLSNEVYVIGGVVMFGGSDDSGDDTEDDDEDGDDGTDGARRRAQSGPFSDVVALA